MKVTKQVYIETVLFIEHNPLLSQRELGKIAGLSPSTVSYIKKSKSYLDYKRILNRNRMKPQENRHCTIILTWKDKVKMMFAKSITFSVEDMR